MATLRRHIRIWELSRDTVGDLTFSDDTAIGVSSRYDAITLKPVSGPAGLVYTTGPGTYVKIAPFSVPRVIAWQVLQVFTVEPIDPFQDPPEVTDVRARLWDGTTEFWFTAGAWTTMVDPVADWNTIEEVNNALGDWDPAVDLGLVFELSTTDGRYTPTVSAFRLLYSIDLVNYLDDWVYGALVQGMKDALRPVSDVIVVSDGTDSIDFGAIVDAFEAPFDVTDVDAVWNETDDPIHRADLLTAYDTGTRVITLASAPASGKALLIRFAFVPMIAVTTSQDYDELDRSPSILFDRISLEDLGEAPSGDYILNVFTDPPVGVTLRPPRRSNLVVNVTLTAPLAVDLHRVAEAVTQFLQERRVISSPSTGERATLRIVDTFDDAGIPNLSDLLSGSMSFRLENLYIPAYPAVEAGQPGGEDSYGVGRVGFTVSTDTASEPLSDFIGGS